MVPFFWRDTTNFGDWCNNILWPKLIPELIDDDYTTRLIGVGSLLKSTLRQVSGHKVIFGSGSGYGAIPSPHEYSTWRFYFVRGPLTARAFNLEESAAIVDGAWLFGLFDEYQPRSDRAGIAFIPHWTSAQHGRWRSVCDSVNYRYINPLSAFSDVIDGIANSNLVITESLHGAIFADLMRVPWIPISIAPDFLPFKWLDWTESIGVSNCEVAGLPLSGLGEYLRHGTMPEYRHPDLLQRRLMLQARNLPIDSRMASGQTAYSLKVKAKQTLKRIVQPPLKALTNHLSPLLFRQWEQDRHGHLAVLLKKTASLTAYLSTDQIRQQKLEQLQLQVDKLRISLRVDV